MRIKSSSPRWPSRILMGGAAALLFGLPAGIISAPMAVAAPATRLYVATNGQDTASCTQQAPCLTISHAISIAPAHAVIDVGPGTYNESLVVTEPLTLQGAGAGKTIVNGWGKDPGTPYAGTLYIGTTGGTTGGQSGGIGGNVTVSGFTFENPNPDAQTYGDGVCLQPILVGVYDGNAADQITITHNRLVEGTADPNQTIDGPIGLDTYYSTASLVADHNDISGVWQGALLEDNGPSTLSHNTFTGLIPLNSPSSCLLSASTTATYQPEGILFLADAAGSWTNQEADHNQFSGYAGDGIDVAAVATSLSGVDIGHNRFTLGGFHGANAIGLFADNGGTLSNVTLSHNDGTVVAPTVPFAMYGGTITGVVQDHENIRSVNG